jgi:hypothetical protein
VCGYLKVSPLPSALTFRSEVFGALDSKQKKKTSVLKFRWWRLGTVLGASGNVLGSSGAVLGASGKNVGLDLASVKLLFVTKYILFQGNIALLESAKGWPKCQLHKNKHFPNPQSILSLCLKAPTAFQNVNFMNIHNFPIETLSANSNIWEHSRWVTFQ